MAKILVTGGAGFIGSHLCEALLKLDIKVLVVDSFNDFYDPELKRNNIIKIQNTMKKNKIDNSKFKVLEGDICDISFLNGIAISEKIDVVVHLAAYAGVRPSIKDPHKYAEVNILGTINMLEFCKARKINRFVFASSSSVYGNNSKVPFSENDRVDNPISPYAATKKAGELICHSYHHLENINIACLRFFTVYGPRQRPDLAISKFSQLILNSEEVPFYGDGSTERDYTYIDDIIEGVLKSIDWTDTKEKKYEIFNLGESRTIRLDDMVKTLEKALEKKARLSMLPIQPGDVKCTFADISKAKRILGYSPQTTFEDGIKKYIDWIGINKIL